MYYVVGLGKSGQAFLTHFPDALVWDNSANLSSAVRSLTPPHEVPWEKVKALILSPGIPHTYPAPHEAALMARAHDVPIWCDVEVFLQTYPFLFPIGITGTNGKSTTTALITHMLIHSGIKALMGGNIGEPVFQLNPSLLKDVCVLELSSYQLERLPSWKERGKIGVITNITADHLARHGGMKGYIKAKQLILDVPQALIGIDTPATGQLYETFQKKHPCLIPVSVTQVLKRGIYVREGILFENGKETMDLRPFKKLPGLHNAQNMALSFGVGRLKGIESQTIALAFSSFGGLAHRLEWVGQSSDPIHFINDSKATNAGATAQGLAAYTDIFWIVGGRSKDTGLAGLEPFYPKIRKAYLIGEAAEEFHKILKPHVPTALCGTLETALMKAWADAKKLGKGVVLLSPACASWDQYNNFEERGNHFKEIVHQLLGDPA